MDVHFDGAVGRGGGGRKRTVRGARKTGSKSDFLEQTRAARAAREGERQRHAAAMVIQSHWRAARVAREVRAAELASFDARCADLGRLQAALGAAFVTPLPVALQLARGVLVLGASLSAERFAQLAAHLRAATADLAQPGAAEAAWLLGRAARLALSHLPAPEAEALVLQLCQRVPGEAAAVELLRLRVSEGLPLPEGPPALLAALLGLSEAAPLAPAHLPRLQRRVEQLAARGRRLPMAPFLWHDAQALPLLLAAPLDAGMLVPLLELCEAPGAPAGPLAAALNAILARDVPLSALPEEEDVAAGAASVEDDEDDEDSDEDAYAGDEERALASLAVSVKRERRRVAAAEAQRAPLPAADAARLHEMLVGGPAMRALLLADSGTLEVMGLLGQVLRRWGRPPAIKGAQRRRGLAAAILTGVAFAAPGAAMVARLWDALTSSTDNNNNNNNPDALFLFASAYSHLLCALDDDEFYVQQIPFARAALVDVVVGLRDRLLVGSDTVQLAVARLFNQLYDRNTRREFCPAGAWYLPGVEPSARVLATYPQVVPFDERVERFHGALARIKAEHEFDDFAGNPARYQVKVRRASVFEDSFRGLNRLGAELRRRVQITFVDEHGMDEAGIDGGGLFKEWLVTLSKQAFDPQYGLFTETPGDHKLFPSPTARLTHGGSSSSDEFLEQYAFLGRIIGKAVYEGVLVEPQFAPAFLNKVLGRLNFTDDLHSVDPELYRGLMSLKAYQGDVRDLCLHFSVASNDFGAAAVTELVPNGDSVQVTNENRLRYIQLVAHYKLNVQSRAESRAFLRGFAEIIPLDLLRMFSPAELQLLIGGSPDGFDVADLRRHCGYAGGYSDSHEVVRRFWGVVETFSPEELSLLLKFVTSCSRPPLLGFAHLQPRFCITRVPIQSDDERLPSASTCMSALRLPTYASAAVMKEKLLYVIRSGAGFDLT